MKTIYQIDPFLSDLSILLERNEPIIIFEREVENDYMKGATSEFSNRRLVAYDKNQLIKYLQDYFNRHNNDLVYAIITDTEAKFQDVIDKDFAKELVQSYKEVGLNEFQHQATDENNDQVLIKFIANLSGLNWYALAKWRHGYR